MKSQIGYLILEDGSLFEGLLLNGIEGVGEVVFNTSHSGYEEMASDPSYYNQVLVTTCPMQGNYGCDPLRFESEDIRIAGLLCLEMQNSERDSTWLDKLSEFNVPVLTEVDTRKITLHLRDRGVLWGGVFVSSDVKAAQEKIKKVRKSKEGKDWTAEVSVKEVRTFSGEKEEGPHLGILDFGYKKNILRELLKRSSKVSLFPSTTSAEKILSSGLHGLMLSNGPGDPAAVGEPVKTIESLVGKLPIMGICMGHQLLGRALGVETYKLKFGHRGANHPIKCHKTDTVYMSSQNHGYALKKEDLQKKGIQISHTNLNDQTVSGISMTEKNCFSLQFHPESHPGPHEAAYLFDDFAKSAHSFITSKSQGELHV